MPQAPGSSSSLELSAQWHEVHPRYSAAIAAIHLGTPASSQSEPLYPLNINSLFLPPHSHWQPQFYFLSLLIWTTVVMSYKWIIQSLFFCVWLFLLSRMSWSFLHVATGDRISFLTLDNTPSSFTVPTFAWNVPLASPIFFEEISSHSHSVVVLYFFALGKTEGKRRRGLQMALLTGWTWVCANSGR